ncbi:MAG: hypothetical protein GY856_14205 [bacterium]|nr:hypothetical protein [bacterium]
MQSGWCRFCRMMTAIFYRRREASGVENLPRKGPVILCANHVNALVDAVVIQANCPCPVHPLARSGLFRSPLLRPLLALQQAVPIYRRRRDDEGVDESARRNLESFQQCYEYLDQGRVLLIFPEGQSHSDPRLRPIKTGAARLALGFHECHGIMPAVVPVGLTFTHKGRFRTGVLVQYGQPVPFPATSGEAVGDEEPEAAVRRYTLAIEKALESVTLNVDSWKDLRLLHSLQSFFALRRRHRRRRRSLAYRFRSLQQLIAAHRWLRLTRPEEVAVLSSKLTRFERLCRRFGIRDYHLDIHYRPGVIARFVARSLAFALLVFPPALWGLLNSGIPYLATRWTSRLTARGRDQYDTAGMIFGLVFFLVFWGGQTFAVFWFFGVKAAVVYAAGLPITSAVALMVGKQRQWIVENTRVFFLFLRKRNVQPYLRSMRRELEVDLALMARMAKRGIPPPSPAGTVGGDGPDPG